MVDTRADDSLANPWRAHSTRWDDYVMRSLPVRIVSGRSVHAALHAQAHTPPGRVRRGAQVSPNYTDALLETLAQCQRARSATHTLDAVLQSQIVVLRAIRDDPHMPERARATARSRLNDSRRVIRFMDDFSHGVEHLEMDIQNELDRQAHNAQNLPERYAMDDLTLQVFQRVQPRIAGLNADYEYVLDLDTARRNRAFLARVQQRADAAGNALPAPQSCERGPGGGAAGAMASRMGRPSGICTVDAAYSAGLDTQARFFEFGRPVARNTHLRSYDLDDGGHVTVQAHRPGLTTSTASRTTRAVLIITSALAGRFISPTAAVLGAGATALMTSLILPKNATWQGYTVSFYRSESRHDSPWKVRYFYGWLRSPSVGVAVTVEGERQADNFPNLADDVGGVSWWTWWVGDAAWRPFADAESDANPGAGAIGSVRASQLVQAISAWAPERSATASPSGAVMQSHDAGLTGTTQHLLTRPPLQ